MAGVLACVRVEMPHHNYGSLSVRRRRWKLLSSYWVGMDSRWCTEWKDGPIIIVTRHLWSDTSSTFGHTAAPTDRFEQTHREERAALRIIAVDGEIIYVHISTKTLVSAHCW